MTNKAMSMTLPVIVTYVIQTTSGATCIDTVCPFLSAYRPLLRYPTLFLCHVTERVFIGGGQLLVTLRGNTCMYVQY